MTASLRPVVSVSTPSSPIIDTKTGMITFQWLKWFQNVGRAINAALDQQGAVQGVIGADASLENRPLATKLVDVITNLSDSGMIDGAGLPVPAVGALGGVEANTPVAHQWVYQISTSGIPALSQPAFSDISGTVAASQLPSPTASTLGGVESIGPTSHQWINQIDTSGVPHLSQPAFSDISGQISSGQLPSAGVRTTITTAKLTPTGSNGSMTFTNGILTASTPAT